MSFLGGIHPSTFLNTHDEWHVFAIGFCEVACPWPAFYKAISTELTELIKKERWYYVFGRALGFALLGLFIVGMVKLVF